MIVGTPVAGRDHPDLEGLVGCFLNTVALRVRLEEEETFETLLAKVKTLVLDATQHQSYPYDRLTQRLVPRRDISRHPLFDVLVDMVNFDFSPQKTTRE